MSKIDREAFDWAFGIMSFALIVSGLIARLIFGG